MATWFAYHWGDGRLNQCICCSQCFPVCLSPELIPCDNHLRGWVKHFRVQARLGVLVVLTTRLLAFHPTGFCEASAATMSQELQALLARHLDGNRRDVGFGLLMGLCLNTRRLPRSSRYRKVELIGIHQFQPGCQQFRMLQSGRE